MSLGLFTVQPHKGRMKRIKMTSGCRRSLSMGSTSSGCSFLLRSSPGLSLSFSGPFLFLLLLAILPGVFCVESIDESAAFFTHKGREFHRFSQPSEESPVIPETHSSRTGTEGNFSEEGESFETKKGAFSFNPSPENKAAPVTIMRTPEYSSPETREKVLSSSSPSSASLASSALPFLMLRGAPIGIFTSQGRVSNKNDEDLALRKDSPVKKARDASADAETKKEKEGEREEDISRKEKDSSFSGEKKEKEDEEEGTEADGERFQGRAIHSNGEKTMNEYSTKEKEKILDTLTSSFFSALPSFSLAPRSPRSPSNDEKFVSQTILNRHEEDHEVLRKEPRKKYPDLYQKNPSLSHALVKKRQDEKEEEEERGEENEEEQAQEEGPNDDQGVIDDDLAGGQQSLSTFKITDPRVLSDLFKETPPEIEGRKTGLVAGSLALVSLLAALSKKLPGTNPLGRLGGKVRDYTFLGTSGGFTAALVLEALVSYYAYRVTKQKQLDYFKALKQIDKLYRDQKEEDLYLSPKNDDEKSDKNNSKKNSNHDSVLGAVLSPSVLASLTKQQRHMKAQEELLEALAIKHEPELYGLTPLIFFGVPLLYRGLFGRKPKDGETPVSSLSSSFSSSSSLLGGAAREEEKAKKGLEYGRFIQGGIAVASALTLAWSCYKKWKYRKEFAQLKAKLSSLNSSKESKKQTRKKEGGKESEEKREEETEKQKQEEGKRDDKPQHPTQSPHL